MHDGCGKLWKKTFLIGTFGKGWTDELMKPMYNVYYITIMYYHNLSYTIILSISINDQILQMVHWEDVLQRVTWSDSQNGAERSWIWLAVETKVCAKCSGGYTYLHTFHGCTIIQTLSASKLETMDRRNHHLYALVLAQAGSVQWSLRGGFWKIQRWKRGNFSWIRIDEGTW